MISLIPDYHTENSHPNGLIYVDGSQFTIQSWSKWLKNNLLQPRNLAWYFGRKVTTDCCDPDKTLADTKDCLSDTIVVISKLIRINLTKSPGNIRYSSLPPEWNK